MCIYIYITSAHFVIVDCVPVYGVFAEERQKHSPYYRFILLHLCCDWSSVIQGAKLSLISV
jgi:hypothetical protein